MGFRRPLPLNTPRTAFLRIIFSSLDELKKKRHVGEPPVLNVC